MDENDPLFGLEELQRLATFTKFPGPWEDRLRDAKHVATYRVALFLLRRHFRHR